LVDVPGVSYKKDLVETHYATFLAHMSESEAKKRVSEAIAGVKEAVKSLDHVDAALVVMDATQNPYNPVNSVIIGALESRDIPIIVVANKTDIKGASPSVIKEVYSDYPVVEMSCIRDKTFEPLYKAIAKHHKK
jgi:tRNA U34 5-carboxymethylaminomethyl modifying GTPase MnmE/TrmE